MKLAMTGLVVFALCLGTAGWVGCGGDETGPAGESAKPEAAASKPAGGERAVQQPKERVVEVKTKTGEKVDVQFSADGSTGQDHGVPVFPGAVEAASMSIPGQGSMLSFTTDASADDVYEYYVDELEAKGWSITKKNEDELNIKATQGAKKASFKIHGTSAGTEIAVIMEGA
jgi:hypothetical protein